MGTRGGERAEEARPRLTAQAVSPASQEASTAGGVRGRGGTFVARADRGLSVPLPAAARDERGQPGVLRLLQPQPQLRGALPVSPARRGGHPHLLLWLR